MANVYIYTPGGVTPLTVNGVAVPNLIEAFFAVRTRASQTVESGLVSNADVNCQLEYTSFVTSDQNPILQQGGVIGGAANPLSVAGISPKASGIHRPSRQSRASQGDTVQVVIGASNTTFTVGASTPNSADALGLKLVTERDTRLAARTSS